jgi:hypothetical protein
MKSKWKVRVKPAWHSEKAWTVEFSIDHQGFTLQSFERDSKKHAQWIAKMLRKALKRLADSDPN